MKVDVQSINTHNGVDVSCLDSHLCIGDPGLVLAIAHQAGNAGQVEYLSSDNSRPQSQYSPKGSAQLGWYLHRTHPRATVSLAHTGKC